MNGCLSLQIRGTCSSPMTSNSMRLVTSHMIIFMTGYPPLEQSNKLCSLAYPRIHWVHDASMHLGLETWSGRINRSSRKLEHDDDHVPSDSAGAFSEGVHLQRGEFIDYPARAYLLDGLTSTGLYRDSATMMTSAKGNATETSIVREPGSGVDPGGHIDHQSRLGTEIEHTLTITRGIGIYRRAIFWTLFFCLGQLMTSFDLQVLGNLYATPSFQRDFGYEYKGEYIISAAWQTGLSMGLPIGQVVGSLAAGFPLERLGRKIPLGVCVIGTIGCVFIQFFSPSLPVLLVGELLAGQVLGFYAVITPTFASELCPVALRGILTSTINLFIVSGQLLANGVAAGTQSLDSHWAYKIPFAVQWFWPVVILAGLPLAPESEHFPNLSIGHY